VTPIEALLRERIRREGPLSFRDVMQAALYHPEHGYYTTLRGFGAEGDFITSPEHHPAFGWLLGRQALDLWQALGRPRPYRIAELGAGSGALAEPLVGFLAGQNVEVVYTIDEPSPSLRAIQQQRLRDPAFRWNPARDGPRHPHHLVIANEVADALPVHRAVIRNGRPHELCVSVDGATNDLAWAEAAEPHAALEAYIAEVHYTPPEGGIVDICLDLPRFVEDLAERIDEQGMALVLDYTASPPRDSLLTYYRHTMGSNPLVRLGQQDISVHVDLRTLVRLGIAQGLKAGATAQRGLLLNLGFQQVLVHLPRQTDREALGKLVEPDGLGGQIAAVFFLRGLADYRPAGAVGSVDWPEPGRVPSLPPSQAEQDFLSQWHEAFATSTSTSTSTSTEEA
jgi:SAM-dependent MidA family methyltransferase